MITCHAASSNVYLGSVSDWLLYGIAMSDCISVVAQNRGKLNAKKINLGLVHRDSLAGNKTELSASKHFNLAVRVCEHRSI
jgi:hypothetical protein